MDKFELQKLRDEQLRLEYYLNLHKQENLWNAAFNLLSNENKIKFKEALEAMEVKPYETYLTVINSNMHLYHATQDGNKPYFIIGYHNYTKYGNCNGHNHQILETTGNTPDFYRAYNDVDYRDYMVLTFNFERNT